MTRYALPSAMFFKQVDYLLIKMMGMLTLIVIVSEFAVMLLFSWLGMGDILSSFALALADALVLFCFAALPVYMWVVKPVKAAIHASQHRNDILSSAVKNAGDGIMISSREGQIEYVNQAFRDILQCENEDVIGQSIAVIHPIMATSSWKRRFIHAMHRDHVWHDEQWGLRKNGDKYLAKVTVTPILMHECKGISNFITIVRDQTSHHDLEMQYNQAQKMEAVGTLVGGIAHDFNNLLSALSGHIYIATAQLKNAPVKQTAMHEKLLLRLGQMEVLGGRAAEMIQQLMTFARNGDVEKTTLDLPVFIREALTLAEVSLPANIDFQSDIDHGHMTVCANATQLQQILMNLINNARDALIDIKQPQIRVSLTEVGADHVSLHRLAAPAQSYVEICVIDNGCGISEENLTKIMEPFFTTKAVGKGTGLGLSMVYGIVQDHHGYIDITSQPGEGTSIHIFLPLMDCASCEKQTSCEKQPTGVYQGKGETILLVDDQQHVRETYREVLESLGYDVLEACDGVEALDVFARNAELIAAVLSDVVMPRMQGVELAYHIKRDHPGMPVILMSGYDKDDVLNDNVHEVVDHVLTKPFSVKVISSILYQLLYELKAGHESDWEQLNFNLNVGQAMVCDTA